MEQPQYDLWDLMVVEAKDEDDVEEIYNKVNNCSYFYSKTLRELPDDKLFFNKEYFMKKQSVLRTRNKIRDITVNVNLDLLLDLMHIFSDTKIPLINKDTSIRK